jgi:hypothetical protein
MRKKDGPVGEEEKWGAEEINAASLHSSLSLSQRNSLLRSLSGPCIFVRQAAVPLSLYPKNGPGTM